MKALIGISLFVSAICVADAVHSRHVLSIQACTSDILRDQLSDYTQQIHELRSRRSYEDGLRDGIENADSINYMRGYHAATSSIHDPYMVGNQ